MNWSRHWGHFTSSNKTVDFRVFGNKIKNINLLIELSSLRESELQKNKTWAKGEFFGCVLNGDDEVSAYCKAQNVLMEKAAKFSSENIDNQFNIIILDMRSSILGCCDGDDYKNILYGGKKLSLGSQRKMKNGKLFPGIFCSTHPESSNADLAHLRKSIHYFGFVVEKNYTQDELATRIQWFKNPDLVTNDLPGLDLKKLLSGNVI